MRRQSQAQQDPTLSAGRPRHPNLRLTLLLQGAAASCISVHLHTKMPSHQMHQEYNLRYHWFELTIELPLQETRELQAEKAELEAVGRRGSNVSEQPDVLPQYDSGDGQPASGGEAVWCM